MAKLGNALAIIGAGMTGYMRGKEMREEQEQRRADRAWQEEQRTRQRQQWADDDRFKVSMRDAAKPVTVQDGSSYQPTLDDDGNAMPANPTIGTLSVAGQKYSDPAKAQAAAAEMSTPAASMRRQAAVMQGAGRPVEAQQLHDLAKKLEDEGAVSFIDRNYQRMPSLEDIKAGKPVDFDLDGVPDFNGAGKVRIPEGARGRAKVLKLPNGMEIPDFEVVDKDGKVVAPSARRIEALYGYTRAERDRAEREMFKDGKDREHQVTMEGIAQQQADTAEAAARSKEGSTMPRMDEVDRIDLTNLGKRIEDIDSTILKARAEGTWDESGPVAKALLASRGALEMKRDAIIGRYRAGGNSDPLGLRNGAGSDAPPKSKMELILEDMKRNKVSNARVQIDGRPEVTVGQQQQPAVKAAPAPAGPGLLQQLAELPLVKRIAALGVDYTTPEGKAMLKARVAQAASGGEPLNEVEALRARQAGLL